MTFSVWLRHVHGQSPWASAMLALAVVVFATLCMTPSFGVAAEPRERRCVVIDSDAGLDDFRAVAALASLRRIAA
jgi:hypothetical protein